SSSQSSAPHVADDKFTISLNNNLDELRRHRGFERSNPEYSHNIGHQNLTIEMIVVLACLVSTHQPNYTLLEHQCYWYASTVWIIACNLAEIDNPYPSRSNTGTNTALLVTLKPRHV